VVGKTDVLAAYVKLGFTPGCAEGFAAAHRAIAEAGTAGASKGAHAAYSSRRTHGTVAGELQLCSRNFAKLGYLFEREVGRESYTACAEISGCGDCRRVHRAYAEVNGGRGEQLTQSAEHTQIAGFNSGDAELGSAARFQQQRVGFNVPYCVGQRKINPCVSDPAVFYSLGKSFFAKVAKLDIHSIGAVLYCGANRLRIRGGNKYLRHTAAPSFKNTGKITSF